AERQADSIGQGLQRRADSLSRNASAERAGRAIERGVDTFAGNTNATKRALYWQADQFIPEQTPVQLQNTWREVVDLTTPTAGATATTSALIQPTILRLRENLAADLAAGGGNIPRSEEHTSELQSRENLVCRLLLEKKKTITAKTDQQ